MKVRLLSLMVLACGFITACTNYPVLSENNYALYTPQQTTVTSYDEERLANDDAAMLDQLEPSYQMHAYPGRSWSSPNRSQRSRSVSSSRQLEVPFTSSRRQGVAGKGAG